MTSLKRFHLVNRSHGANPWLSSGNLGSQNVSKDDLKPNMIRACVDLRIPNKYMDRNKITQGLL